MLNIYNTSIIQKHQGALHADQNLNNIIKKYLHQCKSSQMFALQRRKGQKQAKFENALVEDGTSTLANKRYKR